MSTAFPLTDQQRAVVTTTGQSVLVSAAAGSGKTTVLAQRCAYLVCDAPLEHRCEVDQLLVLTFTEAAAAEMRSRIIEAIRTRVQESSADHRLHEQLVLADVAQISTIHGFCLWMIRRWFDRAQIDPMASVLSAEDASVFKREVLDELFESCYAASKTGGSPLGEDLVAPDSRHKPTDFEHLVEVYGLGQDRDIATFVLKLYEFTTSLPDPQAWLEQACTNLTQKPDWVIQELLCEFMAEIDLQIPHVSAIAQVIKAGDACGHDYARMLESYASALGEWKTKMADASKPSDGLDQGCHFIQEYSWGRADSLRKQSDHQKQTRKDASRLVEQVKRLFHTRIKERFGYFCSQEWIAGLQQVAPFIHTLIGLVSDFDREYSARKRRLNALDFADLERLALDLVNDCDGNVSPVAEALRDRFKHVLVDEFQDVSPIQKAILESVSREHDLDRPSNLFVVGDVKQSIYRFRLAEPEIFLERLTEFRKAALSQKGKLNGKALFLQQNFRSRIEIIDTVNFFFRRLMTGKQVALDYDDESELRSGLPAEVHSGHVPVELHLLERRMPGANGDSEPDEETSEDDRSEVKEPAAADLDRGLRYSEPPAQWDPVVREAYLAATKIRELTESAESGIRYGDIAILLRNTKFTADRVAEVLSRMGIPAHAQVGGSLMGAREVRDLVAALQILDNLQQDIPLAGVLRSGIFGDCFNEDELVEIRLIDRDMPFHAAVRCYARNGTDRSLSQRLETLLRRIQIYRDDATRHPLAQTVWKLLEKQGYLAYVGGLPNAAQRQANLLKIYDLARGFHSARRQGLHRFLRLIESLDEEDKPIAVAPAGGAGDNVVRIMSIHHAKGMEFPVVFLLGLGTKFNLGDRNGRMIFERKSKIGFRAIDTARMLEYPTAVHQLVASEVERSTREEELRILYVALTRARQRLILTGSMDHVDRFDGNSRGCLQITPLSIATARTPLDWILPALHSATDGYFSGLGRSSENPTMQVSLHLPAEMQTWSLDSAFDKDREALLHCVSRFDPLPPQEHLGPEDEIEPTLRRIKAVYPWLSASSFSATFAASAFGALQESEPGAASPAPATPRGVLRSAHGMHDFEEAARRGSLTHRALEHLNFHIARDGKGVLAELDRMVTAQVLKESEKSQILHEGIAWFVTTPLADAIRCAADYRRELRFVATEHLSALDPAVFVAGDDRVLVRGIVDGILVRDAECEIIDFKTDTVTASQANARCEVYRPQMQVYARAVERLWNRPVKCCRLVFLKANCTIDVYPNGKSH